ncbi:hypothetical protein, partial [Staphylococcus sp. GDK8D30P]|uniref:hypothetical protein n=1 Tax=Staphylococcus sp. GDK8D30P TaxID=2804090 RepID=UPI001AEC267B
WILVEDSYHVSQRLPWLQQVLSLSKPLRLNKLTAGQSTFLFFLLLQAFIFSVEVLVHCALIFQHASLNTIRFISELVGIMKDNYAVRTLATMMQ